MESTITNSKLRHRRLFGLSHDLKYRQKAPNSRKAVDSFYNSLRSGLLNSFFFSASDFEMDEWEIDLDPEFLEHCLYR